MRWFTANTLYPPYTSRECKGYEKLGGRIEPQNVVQVAAGILRKPGELLLVRQRYPHQSRSHWTLPAGVADPGELLREALEREVREESGLEVTGLGTLAYVMQLDLGLVDAGFPADQLVAYCFEVTDWEGELYSDDPDGVVSEARFFEIDQALLLLEGLPDTVREPLMAYLADSAAPGALWSYRRSAEGRDIAAGFGHTGGAST